MKTSLSAAFAALALATAAPHPASAHGDAVPMYGGTAQIVSDLQFELVPGPAGASLYVVDHGKPADASAMSGKLIVLDGTRKSEAALKPVGGNRLEAAGLAVPKGAKAIATVARPGAPAISVRFAP